MRRPIRLVPALAVLATMVAATPTGAKEISSLLLCGARGACHPVRGDAARQAFMSGSVQASPPDEHAPFYSLVAGISEPGQGEIARSTVRWVPSAGRIRTIADAGQPAWTRPAAQLTRALRKAARGLEPQPASRLGRLRASNPAAQADDVVPPPVGEVLPPPARGEPAADGGSPATVVGLGAGGVAAIVAGGLVLVRRRRRRDGLPGAEAPARPH
jgi:hypothetical protein